MIKRIILFNLLLINILSASSVLLNKTTYTNKENIIVNFTGMDAKNKDWIGIYPKGSSTDWKNVIVWHWTNDTTSGKVTFDALPSGEYEARAFYNNSFKLETQKSFTVTSNNTVPTTLTTNKTRYTNSENIVITFAGMRAKNRDWIAIYPKGSSTDWKNVIAWHWTDDKSNGTVVFNSLPAGEYEARAFYNNSFKFEAKKEFMVIKNVTKKATVRTDKTEYTTEENIIVNFSDMRAKHQDWIGIYPKGSSNAWKNVVLWHWTDDTTNGQITFNALPAGEYEVRAFYNNSFTLEAKKLFTIHALPARVVYEDAENGISPKWVHYFGKEMELLNDGAKGSNHAVRTYAYSGQYINFEHPAKRLKYLELDVRIGVSSHNGNFGVYVKTTKGTRRIAWSVYLNHLNGRDNPVDPFISGDENNIILNNPAPTDYFWETIDNDNFVHYRIDVDATLKLLEPDNEVLSILLFTTSGGDFDNIALAAD